MKKAHIIYNYAGLKSGVTDGARTRDNRNHNPGLYQLSYGHHCFVAALICACCKNITIA